MRSDNRDSPVSRRKKFRFTRNDNRSKQRAYLVELDNDKEAIT